MQVVLNQATASPEDSEKHEREDGKIIDDKMGLIFANERESSFLWKNSHANIISVVVDGEDKS